MLIFLKGAYGSLFCFVESKSSLLLTKFGLVREYEPKLRFGIKESELRKKNLT